MHVTQEDSLAFTIDIRRGIASEGDAATLLSPVVRLLMNGEQVSLVSSIRIEADSEHTLPQIVVRFLERVEPADIARLSEEVKQSVRRSAERLRKIPFVRVESPLLSEV